MRSLPALCLLVLSLPACAPEPIDPAHPDERCHPLAVHRPEDSGSGGCALPFPSSFYLTPDRSALTGLRVHFPLGALPRNRGGADFDPSRLNLLDGFSPATQILVDLGARVDPMQLPAVDSDPAATLAQAAAAPVQLLAFDTGERVPLFAEVDENVTQPGVEPGAPQALLIRPLFRLRPATRYVVALRGLRDRQGAPITVPAFRALTSDALAAGSRLQSLRPRSDEILAFLARQGVPADALTLAWDFHTGSDSAITSNLLTMRDAAFRHLGEAGPGPAFTLVEVDQNPKDSRLLRRISGTFSVPSFLTDPLSPGAGLKLDSAGRPAYSGEVLQADLLVLVPRCAQSATRPLRAVVYGHGLLGGAEEIASGTHRRLAEELCFIEAATTFIGLSAADVPTLAGKVVARFDQLSILTDRLQQAQLNFMILARLLRGALRDAPALSSDGTARGLPLIDDRQVYYVGGSQGGIYGNTIVSLSPDLDRGVLVVGGGNYSMMLPRSINFSRWKELMDTSYPDLLAQQLLLAVSQSFWDLSDPISFARRNLQDRFPGPDGRQMWPKQILLQEAKDDSQVPNVATRTVARTMGLPQLRPVVTPVFGLTQVDGPAPSAYVQYDVMAQPAPSRTNVPGTKDNGAHGSLTGVPAVVQQMDAFLRPDGQVINTCGERCVFPFPR